MATQTKTTVWADVQAILVANKANKALTAALEAILAPKTGGGGSVNPPKVDKDGNITEAYCKFHQRYEVVSDMVLSNGKSKGYCKAALSKWTKSNAKAKSLEAEASALLRGGKADEAIAKANEADGIKSTMNNADQYSYEADWAAFRPAKEAI
jgi:hypothetical protein